MIADQIELVVQAAKSGVLHMKAMGVDVSHIETAINSVAIHAGTLRSCADPDVTHLNYAPTDEMVNRVRESDELDGVLVGKFFTHEAAFRHRKHWLRRGFSSWCRKMAEGKHAVYAARKVVRDARRVNLS